MADSDATETPHGDDGLQDLESLMKSHFFRDAQTSTPRNPVSVPPPDAQSHELLALESLMSSELFSVPTPYRYLPLPNNNLIRLLVLSPAPPSAPLHASLRHAPLSSPGPYEALSYAWGSPTKPSTLLLDRDHAALPITSSLHEALLRLRDPVSARTLWVDAVCIDQAHDGEKSLQVAVMSDIYSSATRVLCWWGEENATRDGGETFRLLRDLGRVSFAGLEGGRVTGGFMRGRGLPGVYHGRWFAAHRFFQRGWFRRGWVIQEVVLGREVVAVCGRESMLAAEMGVGVGFLVNYGLIGWGMGGDAAASLPGLGSFRMMLMLMSTRTRADALYEYASMSVNNDEAAQRKRHHERSMRESMRPLRAAFGGIGSPLNLGSAGGKVVASALESSGVRNEANRMSLFDLTRIFPHCLTTDPRDRYFAMLSMSTEKDEPSLQPDYAESVESTRFRFERYYLLDSKTAYSRQRNRLIMAGMSSRVEACRLPSWMPDLTTGLKTLSTCIAPAITGHCIFNAAGDTENAYQKTDDERTIVARGGVVDVISRVIPAPQPNNGSVDLSVMLDFFQEIDDMTDGWKRPYPRLAPGETDIDIQWRTLVAGTDIRFHTAPDIYRDLYVGDRYRMMEGLVHGASKMEDVFGSEGGSEWMQKWMAISGIGCSVCETAGGLMGLVPRQTAVGDSICIILGEGLPLVLRQTETSAAKHSVIGASYIHGIMFGEVVRSAVWREKYFHLV